MIRASIIADASGKSIHTADPLVNPQDGPVLITETQASTHGTFKTANRTSAGTTAVATPLPGGSIILTDLIVTTDKVNGATLTLQFTDGTNAVIISRSILTDAPANFAIGFTGLWRGWKDGRLDMVTTGNVDATVTCGYYKSIESIDYATWDAQR